MEPMVFLKPHPRSVQLLLFLSRVWLFVTLWTAARQASLSITNFWSLLKLMSIKSVIPCNHLILCCPLLLLSIFPSIRVFSNESVLRISCPKYWNFSFSISLPNECSGLISFGLTLKILLQHHSSKALILWCSAFFIIQCSPPYNTQDSKGKKNVIWDLKWMFILSEYWPHSEIDIDDKACVNGECIVLNW